MTVEIGNDKPATDTNGEYKETNDSAERELECMSRPREFRRVEEIQRNFPMRERFADFGSDEWPLPGSSKTGMRKSGRPGGIVKQRDANFLAERRVELFQGWFEFFDEADQRKLRAENILWSFRSPIPEEDIQFIIDETGEHTIAGSAHELAEFGFGSCNFGEGLHLFL